ncbi:MAG: adenosine deaminase [Psittacicella sp.]
MNYKNLPKIELHCHLDGSMRPSTYLELAKEFNIELPTYIESELIEYISVPASCKDLVEYISKFELPLKLMQTKSSLKRVMYELLEDASKENVKYIEVRFGPQLHFNENLSYDDMISSLIEAIDEAKSYFNIESQLILSFIRTMPKDDIKSILDIGTKYLTRGLIAVDLAGAELEGFSSEFEPYIKYARDLGYRVTIHAGEQGSGKNVLDAVEILKAERIGHGVYTSNDKKAYNLVKEKEITLEMCINSNFHTKAASIDSHPFLKYYNDGIHINLSTDNRTISNTTLSREIETVKELFDLNMEQYKEIYKMSVKGSFAADSVKEKLLSYIDNVL